MKETAKMFSGIDSLAMLRVASKKLKYKRRTLKEKINAQIEHLSYVDIVGDQYSGIACVTAIELTSEHSVKTNLRRATS